MVDRSNEPVWVVVAVDYDKESAFLIDRSISCGEYDIDLGLNVLDDSGMGAGIWVKDAVPGLYRLDLTGWSEQSYEGEWDGGWDVATATLLLAFPERQPDELRDEWSGSPCPVDPDNYWIDDKTGTRIKAQGEEEFIMDPTYQN